jgi:hypothetical protein
MQYELEMICNQIHNTSIEWKPSDVLIHNIYLLLNKLKETDNFDINVYEIFSNSRTNFNFKLLKKNDIIWFNNEGKKQFFDLINTHVRPILCINDYILVNNIHNDLRNLLQLQLS